MNDDDIYLNNSQLFEEIDNTTLQEQSDAFDKWDEMAEHYMTDFIGGLTNIFRQKCPQTLYISQNLIKNSLNVGTKLKILSLDIYFKI